MNIEASSLINIFKRVRENNHFDHFKRFIIGGFVSILLGYFSTYLINKNLSKEDLGLLSYYQNIMTLLASVFSIGVHHAYLRFNNSGYNSTNLAKAVYQISILGTIALLFFSFFVFKNYYISAFSFFILFNERIYYYRSSKLITRMNILKYSASVILIICMVWYISDGKLDFEKVIFFTGIGYLLVFIIGYFSRKTEKKNLDGEIIEYKKIIIYTAPLAGTEIIRWILQYSDQILMKEYLNLVDLANYAVAVRILNVIRILTALFLLYYPMLYFEEADNRNYKIINKTRYGFIISLCIVSITLIILRKSLYLIMGAEQYLDYTNIFVFLVIAEVIRIIGSLFLTFRTYRLQTWYSVLTTFVSAAITISLNFLFLAKYGIIFAALVQVATSIVFLFLVYFLAIKQERKYFRIPLYTV